MDDPPTGVNRLSQRDFYLTRAAEAQADADAAILANVKDRCLRAHAAWAAMAERAARTDEARETSLRAKEAADLQKKEEPAHF